MSQAERLGLIAGAGRFPIALAHAARDAGVEIRAIAFHGITDPTLEQSVDGLHWLHLGAVEALFDQLRSDELAQVVMAGKVSKTLLFERADLLRPDATARALLTHLADESDGAILAALAELLEQRGILLRPQAELVPGLLAAEGLLGRCRPTADQLADMALGWRVAREIGRLDIGQAVVVEGGAVLAVEAIEGTDAAIRRGGGHGRGGASVVKVAKPGQDLRMDLPVIGPGTLEVMLEAGVHALAFEASCTIILDREELVDEADAREVPLVGFGPGGPSRE